MKVLYESSFLKDIKKIDNIEISNKLKDTINQFKLSKSSYNIHNLKKLKNYKYFYRARIGNYRLGIKIDDDTVTFIRFMHRKDIYKIFP